MRRIDIRGILQDPVLRRRLMIRTIIAAQAREGITTTWEQAAAAYDKVEKEKPIETVGTQASQTLWTTAMTAKFQFAVVTLWKLGESKFEVECSAGDEWQGKRCSSEWSAGIQMISSPSSTMSPDKF